MRTAIPKIRKALVAAAAACTVTAAALSDGAVSVDEALAVFAAWSAVAGVWYATNEPSVPLPPPPPVVR